MRVYNWKPYRIPGLVTVALHNDLTIDKFVYLVTPPNYEELVKNTGNVSGDPAIEYYREAHLKSHLRIKYNFNLGTGFSTLIDLIYNFGGVNINPGNGGFKAFIPLEKDATEGILWDPMDAEKIVWPDANQIRRR